MAKDCRNKQKSNHSVSFKKQVASLTKEVDQLKKKSTSNQADKDDDLDDSKAYIMSICKEMLANEVAESNQQKPKAVSLKSILKNARNGNCV